MADNVKKTGKTGTKQKMQLVDPIYQKFTKSVIRALGSTEFYEYFMDAVSKADNEFQFSNRRLEKTVDLNWVDAIEEAIEAFQSVVSSPRNVIQEEELIVNVANAKKGGADVVQHLSQHASLVEKFDEKTGEVRPSRLMQKYREDAIGQYENRLVYTTMEMAFQFTKIRHDSLFSAMGEEFGAKLRLRSDMDSAVESVHMEMFLHIRETDSALTTDDKNRDVFERISRIYRLLGVLMNSKFAQQLAKLPRVKGSVTKTNILKKNPNYRKILQLFEFFQSYDNIGYTIRVIEQNPQISEEFQRDIYHNILFNYLVLKGYLESEKDRRLPAPMKEKRRVLKPKFIKEIIEELTEDYDLPDVEIRKVLIEELTREQLMQEEAEERRRLVEEQAQRKREEAERIRQEKEAEKERLRKEKEAERERLRQEKEAEQERLRYEQMLREQEDRRRSKLLKAEITFFQEHLEAQLDARRKALEKEAQEKQDFADAVKLLEEEEQRRKEEAQREKKRRQEERERIKREKLLEQERARQAELERQEKERLAREAEEARIRQEQERIEAEKRAKQQAEDREAVRLYYDEIVLFANALTEQLQLRQEQAEQARLEVEQWEAERQKRRAARLANTKR